MDGNKGEERILGAIPYFLASIVVVVLFVGWYSIFDRLSLTDSYSEFAAAAPAFIFTLISCVFIKVKPTKEK